MDRYINCRGDNSNCSGHDLGCGKKDPEAIKISPKTETKILATLLIFIFLASFSVAGAEIPGEITVNYSPQIVNYSWEGYFGPEQRVWFNFTIEDKDALSDLSYVKVVAYHRQYSSLGGSNDRRYHYTFMWTWSAGWYEVDLTGHLGSNYAPTDPTAVSGDWKLEITCDDQCVPGLWAIYLEVVDSKNAMTVLTVYVEGYGPYDVVIESVTVAILGNQSVAKAYIEVTNRNPKYGPDVTLVTKIVYFNTTLASQNRTIQVPSAYSSLFSVELYFSGEIGKSYTFVAQVVDPHGISTPEATYTFQISIPAAPVVPPPAVPTQFVAIATGGMGIFFIIAVAFLSILAVLFVRPLGCLIRKKITECACLFGNTFVFSTILSIFLLVYTWVFWSFLPPMFSMFSLVFGVFLFAFSLIMMILHGGRCPIPI